MNSKRASCASTARSTCSISGVGYTTSGTIETKSAFGGRIGLLMDVSKDWGMGVSGGYIAGPNSDVIIRATSGAQSANLTDSRKVAFTRFLLEPVFHAKITNDTSYHLGAGLGFASGRTEETVVCTGNACVTNGRIASTSSNWTGVTWEISPYFSFSKVLLGFRYAVFPKFKGNDQNSKIEWTSASLFAGLKF
jgi:hypothetical protein